MFTLSFDPAGPGNCTFYTCDLTPEYVKLNADYTT
jgi:N-acetylglutamate synthase/N-acetylornithine aminotransferase